MEEKPWPLWQEDLAGPREGPAGRGEWWLLGLAQGQRRQEEEDGKAAIVLGTISEALAASPASWARGSRPVWPHRGLSPLLAPRLGVGRRQSRGLRCAGGPGSPPRGSSAASGPGEPLKEATVRCAPRRSGLHRLGPAGSTAAPPPPPPPRRRAGPGARRRLWGGQGDGAAAPTRVPSHPPFILSWAGCKSGLARSM